MLYWHLKVLFWMLVVRQPGLSHTKTNSVQAEAGARAELGKNVDDQTCYDIIYPRAFS